MTQKWMAAAAALFCWAGLAVGAAAQEGAPFLPEAAAPDAVAKDRTAFVRHPLTFHDGMGHYAHVKPTRELEKTIHNFLTAATTVQPLTYGGGPIMPTVQIYNIFWAPPKVQSGAVATMSAHYMAVANSIARDYAGHTIDSNNTQYYQKVGTVTTYASGLSTTPGAYGSFGGSYVDVNPYPASGCTGVGTPVNCITDSQVQTEIQRVMALKGWTGGLNKIYMVYTASGEDSCLDSATCASNYYCAYHSNIGSTSTAILYSNMPFGYPAGCGNGLSPNNDPAADAAIDSATHEISEAITDPVDGTGWTDASGNEIGDKCGTSYGAFKYDSGKANQFWNGHYYDIQEEWDNHLNLCVQEGP